MNLFGTDFYCFIDFYFYCSKGVSEPALLVRRGCLIVSIDPINAVITATAAFVLPPDGADELLAPLLRRLREAQVFKLCLSPFASTAAGRIS